jgi:hypothetical protein
MARQLGVRVQISIQREQRWEFGIYLRAKIVGRHGQKCGSE